MSGHGLRRPGLAMLDSFGIGREPSPASACKRHPAIDERRRHGVLPFSEACERNKNPILEVLREAFALAAAKLPLKTIVVARQLGM